MTARAVSAGVVALAVCAAPEPAFAQEPTRDKATGDRYSVAVRSETYLQLYERALLPGPAGAVVTDEHVAPIHQYISLRAIDLDAPWREDSLSVELSGWGGVTVGDLTGFRSPEATVGHRVDGDLQAANVKYTHDGVWLRLGRQHYAGGAARYARFDGLSAGGQLDMGLGLEAYGGLAVLPRWSQRPGYHHLGSPSDTLLRDPEAIEQPDRVGHWLAGGRIYYHSTNVDGGASFHEAHENSGLAHRNVGVDARVTPFDEALLGGIAILDLDSTRLADARAWGEIALFDPLDVGVEYLHAEPALFLSRQSVLSVFSTDAYDEAGGRLRYRPKDWLHLEGSGFVQLYSEDTGVRGEVAARLTPNDWRTTAFRIGYTRVQAPENGYHSLRNTLRQGITDDVAATAEAYLYFYDEAILERDSSRVFAGTVQWWAAEQLRVMWGASLASSPYAALDAQTLVRLAYGIEEGAP